LILQQGWRACRRRGWLAGGDSHPGHHFFYLKMKDWFARAFTRVPLVYPTLRKYERIAAPSARQIRFESFLSRTHSRRVVLLCNSHALVPSTNPPGQTISQTPWSRPLISRQGALRRCVSSSISWFAFSVLGLPASSYASRSRYRALRDRVWTVWPARRKYLFSERGHIPVHPWLWQCAGDL
jgi:hypothetical protein